MGKSQGYHRLPLPWSLNPKTEKSNNFQGTAVEGARRLAATWRARLSKGCSKSRAWGSVGDLLHTGFNVV